MKHHAFKSIPVLRALTCDRCLSTAEHPGTEFFEFTSIRYTAGYGSIFGDGNRVEIDLCQACLQATLGPWLRITPGEQVARLEADLKSFDPAVHGGEWPAATGDSDSP